MLKVYNFNFVITTTFDSLAVINNAPSNRITCPTASITYR